MKYRIVPAIIAESQDELDDRMGKVKNHASYLQLDIMDGVFVPTHSLDFDFKLPPADYQLEAHLMISNPEEWIDENWKRFDTILVHIESCKNPEKLIRTVNQKIKLGFALSPETPLDRIKKYLDDIGQVLVMTVNPGSYGKRFLPEALDKVKELRNIKPDLDIEVDGGINPETIKGAYEAGANIFVSGSYIMKFDNIKEAIDILKNNLGI